MYMYKTIMAKLTDEQKQDKLIKALKASKKPLSAKQAVEATGMAPDDVTAAGKALMKAHKVRFVGEKNNLLELVPVEKKASSKDSGKKVKKVAKKSSDWADDDDDDVPAKDSDDEDDADKDSDAEIEDLEDETVTIVKINKKAGSIVVEYDDEEIELIADEDEDIDVTDFEKGQEVVVSATWDEDDEEWTLTDIEEADGPDKDSDDEDAPEKDSDEDDEPKVKAKPGSKKAPAKKSSAPAKKKPAKEFTMQFKSVDTLTAKELKKKIAAGSEAAEALFGEDMKDAAECIMRVLPKLKKALAKLEEDDD